MPTRQPNVENLYRWGVIDVKTIRRINVVLALLDGVRPSTIARRYEISKVTVYKIKQRLDKSFE